MNIKKMLGYKGLSQEVFPNIALYMDQLLSFFDDGLADFKRKESDRILSKTMVNNYVKAKVFPAPTKKKYSKNQMMQLLMIYHFKNVLSLEDIKTLMDVDKEGNWKDEVSDVYERFSKAESLALESIKEKCEARVNEDHDHELAMQLATWANVYKTAAEHLLKKHEEKKE